MDNNAFLAFSKAEISQPPTSLFHSGFGDRCWLKKHGKKDLIVFSDEALFELRKYFNSLDQRGTGSIGVDELEDPFIALGLSQTRQDVQALIDSVDEDKSGKIEFDEFLSIMSRIRKGKDSKSAIYNFFQKMSSGNLGQDMDKTLPFRLNVSQYRRRRILESIMAPDKNKKQRGNRILQAFKKQISNNPSLRQASMDAKKLMSATGGLTMYNKAPIRGQSSVARW